MLTATRVSRAEVRFRIPVERWGWGEVEETREVRVCGVGWVGVGRV